ncbi:MAG: leucine-rich repeat domain-containing protein [Spirochaetes bacterium]|nr:leucine-rich repeat domain-containing protein [Spirochaetota bacterium]
MLRKFVCIAFLAIFAVVGVYAQYDPEGHFGTRSIGGGQAEITRYIGGRTIVRIPPRISIWDIVSIGANAFAGQGLTSVTIPNTVTGIGAGAFADNRLTSVVLPPSVLYVAEGAFDPGVVLSGGHPNIHIAGRAAQADQDDWHIGFWRLALTTIVSEGYFYYPEEDQWTADYFIEFRADGTFSELNFWNEQAVVNGTWTANNANLTLTHGTTTGPIRFVFVGQRTTIFNSFGNIMMMEYSRTQDGNTWHYTHVFERAR